MRLPGSLLDWLNSAAGSILDAPLSAEAFDRLLASAREVHALFDQERVVTALQKLRAKACDVAGPALEGLYGLAQALGARAKTALEKAFSAETAALRASERPTTPPSSMLNLNSRQPGWKRTVEPCRGIRCRRSGRGPRECRCGTLCFHITC